MEFMFFIMIHVLLYTFLECLYIFWMLKYKNCCIIFGGTFIVQLYMFWRFNIIVQGNFGQEIEDKIFEKLKMIESMFGESQLHEKEAILQEEMEPQPNF